MILFHHGDHDRCTVVDGDSIAHRVDSLECFRRTVVPTAAPKVQKRLAAAGPRAVPEFLRRNVLPASPTLKSSAKLQGRCPPPADKTHRSAATLHGEDFIPSTEVL
jgi:hypothetical protein